MALTCPCQLVLDRVNAQKVCLLEPGTIVDAISMRNPTSYTTLNNSQFEVINRHTYRDVNSGDVYDKVFASRKGNQVYIFNAPAYEGGLPGEVSSAYWKVGFPWKDGYIAGAGKHPDWNNWLYVQGRGYLNYGHDYFDLNAEFYDDEGVPPCPNTMPVKIGRDLNRIGTASTAFSFVGMEEAVAYGEQYYGVCHGEHFRKAVLSEFYVDLEGYYSGTVFRLEQGELPSFLDTSNRYNMTTNEHQVVAIWNSNDQLPMADVMTYGQDGFAYSVCFDPVLQKWCAINSVSGAKVEGISHFLDMNGDLWRVVGTDLKLLGQNYVHVNYAKDANDAPIKEPSEADNGSLYDYVAPSGVIVKSDVAGTPLSLITMLNDVDAGITADTLTVTKDSFLDGRTWVAGEFTT